MTEQRHFDGVVFDAELRLAWTEDGEQVKLTRRERDLVRRFLASPGQVLTRDQLLDTFDISDTFDRSIDYVVHRLRHKLGDRARKPRFIETLYGEGYVWVGQPKARDSGTALLLLGSIGTNEALPEPQGEIFRQLGAGLVSEFGADILLRPHWRYSDESGRQATFALGTDFLALGETLHIALVLRHVPTNEIVNTFRLTAEAGRLRPAIIGQLVTQVRTALWSYVARPSGLIATPYDPPLELRLVEAAMMFVPAGSVWAETTQRLQSAPHDRANVPQLDILWGLGIMCRLVMGDDGHFADMDGWRKAEEEMETIALRTLPRVQHDPMLSLAVVRLLHFSHRGHLALAEELVRHSLSTGAAFGAASVMLGILHMARGGTGDALECFENALERSAEGELYWSFVTVLKCAAMMAAGQWDEVDSLAIRLFLRNPATRDGMALFLINPEKPEKLRSLEPLLAGMDLDRARRMVRYLYMVYARHFVLSEQRQRVMSGLLSVLRMRFSLAELCTELPGEDRAILASAFGEQADL